MRPSLRMLSRQLALGTVSFAALVSATQAFANGGAHWTGAVDHDWVNIDNWEPYAPVEDGRVFIDGANSVVVYGSALADTYSYLNILSSSTLTINGDLTVTDDTEIGSQSELLAHNTLIVDGSRALFHSGSALRTFGGKLSLSVINGASLTVGSFLSNPDIQDHTPSVEVLIGEGSNVSATDTTIDNGSFEMEAGSTLESVSLTVGFTGEATATIAGNATLTELIIGRIKQGEMRIQDGGTVSAQLVSIGETLESADSKLEVTGTGSSLTVSDRLQVAGPDAAFGTLNVLTGASVQTSILTIAEGLEADVSDSIQGLGNVLVASDASLSVSDTAYIGTDGKGTLTVSFGGLFSAPKIVMAQQVDGVARLYLGNDAKQGPTAVAKFDVDVIEMGSGNSTIVFNVLTASEPFAFATELVGEGLVQIVNGAVSFTGDSLNFNGRIEVSGGSLLANSILSGAVAVSDNGVLGGSGTVGAVTFASGGILSPGNSIGTLTINGDLTLSNDTIYQYEIGSDLSSDKVVVLGNATLGGAALRVIALDPTTSYLNGQRYTVFEAESITGSLNPQLANDSAFLTSTVEYSATDATLVLAVKTDPQDPTDPHPVFPKVAGTENERRTASALDQLDQTPGSASLALYNAVLMLNADQAVHAFNQLSGEGQASVRTALLEGGSQVRAQ
ncbi:hypothetical protein FPY71_17345, partial [Aureimonas fodinaquatilis]